MKNLMIVFAVACVFGCSQQPVPIQPPAPDPPDTSGTTLPLSGRDRTQHTNQTRGTASFKTGSSTDVPPGNFGGPEEPKGPFVEEYPNAGNFKPNEGPNRSKPLGDVTRNGTISSDDASKIDPNKDEPVLRFGSALTEQKLLPGNPVPKDLHGAKLAAPKWETVRRLYGRPIESILFDNSGSTGLRITINRIEDAPFKEKTNVQFEYERTNLVTPLEKEKFLKLADGDTITILVPTFVSKGDPIVLFIDKDIEPSSLGWYRMRACKDF